MNAALQTPLPWHSDHSQWDVRLWRNPQPRPWRINELLMPFSHERKTCTGVVTACPECWNEPRGWGPKDSGHPCREIAPKDPVQAWNDGHRTITLSEACTPPRAAHLRLGVHPIGARPWPKSGSWNSALVKLWLLGREPRPCFQFQKQWIINHHILEWRGYFNGWVAFSIGSSDSHCWFLLFEAGPQEWKEAKTEATLCLLWSVLLTHQKHVWMKNSWIGYLHWHLPSTRHSRSHMLYEEFLTPYSGQLLGFEPRCGSVCVYTCVCLCVHICVWRPEVDLRFLLCCFTHWFWDRDSH